jgi:hypothetical protein
VIRQTTVLLVLVLSVASGRTLACELACLAATPAQAPESCHQQSAQRPLTLLSAAHSCDHAEGPFSLAPVKVTVLQQLAFNFVVHASVSSVQTNRAIELAANSPPRTSDGSRPRVTAILRI